VWTLPCWGVPVHLACGVWIPRLYRRHAHISAAVVGWWPTACFLAAWARPQGLRHVLEGHCSPLAVASTGRRPPVGSRRVAAPPCLSFRGGRAAHARRISTIHRPARGVNTQFFVFQGSGERGHDGTVKPYEPVLPAKAPRAPGQARAQPVLRPALAVPDGPAHPGAQARWTGAHGLGTLGLVPGTFDSTPLEIV
jgi:hypothetical protein